MESPSSPLILAVCSAVTAKLNRDTSPLKLAKQLVKQAKDSLCREVAATHETLGSCYSYDFICSYASPATLIVATGTVVQSSFCPHLLHISITWDLQATLLGVACTTTWNSGSIGWISDATFTCPSVTVATEPEAVLASTEKAIPICSSSNGPWTLYPRFYCSLGLCWKLWMGNTFTIFITDHYSKITQLLRHWKPRHGMLHLSLSWNRAIRGFRLCFHKEWSKGCSEVLENDIYVFRGELPHTHFISSSISWPSRMLDQHLCCKLPSSRGRMSTWLRPTRTAISRRHIIPKYTVHLEPHHLAWSFSGQWPETITFVPRTALPTDTKYEISPKALFSLLPSRISDV